MKKIVTLAILFLTVFSAQAQVPAAPPQAICYQAVATNQQGNELVSQSIRVRLSVLKNSASGAEQWVETHSVTTDGFGLFDLMIGLGVRTGGDQTSFSGIKWGEDKHFLKVEMDITGGNNFVLMGTNQMVSVPYAFYSERSRFTDSSRITYNSYTSNYSIRSDTARLSFFSNRSDTARLSFFSNRSDTARFSTTARLADTAKYALKARFSDTAQFAWLADSARRAARAGFADTATAAHRAQTAVNATNAQNAINAQNAVNAQTAINATNAVNAQNSITAINAQRADVAQRATYSDTARVATTALDDFDRDPNNEIQRMTFNENSGILRLTRPNGADTVSFSAATFRSPGASIDYPFGILGDAILITQNYVVPIGKTLFISAANNAITLTDGRRLEIEPGMPIIPAGTSIRDCFCSGLLVPNQAYATPLILDFAQTADYEYEVPDSTCLIVKSGTNGSARDMSFLIDGVNYSFYSGASASPRLVVIPAKKKIKRGIANVGGSFVVTGYLLKKN